MRGLIKPQVELFSYISIEDRVPLDHALRKIDAMVRPILAAMSDEFDKMYSPVGRASIPPESLLRALLLQVLYTIRSERQLVEHLNYNLLYRWFVGLGSDDPVWDHSTFSKNRDRLIDGGVADRFFSLIVNLASNNGLISSEHFSVDGTLIEAWASLKSFMPKDEVKKDDDSDDHSDRNRWVNFKGQSRSNETHESTTDPDSRMATKSSGQTAKLSYQGHVTMENRNGLAVDARLTQATGTAERDAAFEMACALDAGSTVGADKGYDTNEHTENLKTIGIKSHASQNIHARRHTSSIDGRTTRHEGYGVSQRKRMRIEEIFGWLKTIGLMRRPMMIGTERMSWMFTLSLCVYNLVRIKNLVTI